MNTKKRPWGLIPAALAAVMIFSPPMASARSSTPDDPILQRTEQVDSKKEVKMAAAPATGTMTLINKVKDLDYMCVTGGESSAQGLVFDDHPACASTDPSLINSSSTWTFDDPASSATASSGLYQQVPYFESTKAASGNSISGNLNLISPADRTCVPCAPHLAHQALAWRTGFA